MFNEREVSVGVGVEDGLVGPDEALDNELVDYSDHLVRRVMHVSPVLLNQHFNLRLFDADDRL